MPPKKAAKKSAGSSPSSKQPAVCSTLEQLRNTVEKIYSLRHKTVADRAEYASPILHGGTFLEIARRAWAAPEALLQQSLELVKTCGIVDDSTDLDQFAAKYMTIDARPTVRRCFFFIALGAPQ